MPVRHAHPGGQRRFPFAIKETTMKITTLAASLVLALGVGAAGTAAAMHHEKFEAAFKAADKDADGTLDKEEAKAMPRVAKHFDEIDADKDGTVSKDEIHTFMKEHHKDKGKGMHTEMHKDMHGKDGHDMPMGEKK